MKQLFKIDGEVYSFLHGMYQFILLNLLIVFTSLPIITLPCALITGYQLLKDYNQQEMTIKRYFLFFRKNVIPSLILIIIFGFVFLILFLLLSFTRGTIFQFLVLFLIAFFIVFFSNTFILSNNQISVQSLLKFALGITLKYAGFNSIGLAIMFSSIVIPVFLPNLGLLWILFGISIPMFVQVSIHKQIMKRVVVNRIRKE